MSDLKKTLKHLEELERYYNRQVAEFVERREQTRRLIDEVQLANTLLSKENGR